MRVLDDSHIIQVASRLVNIQPERSVDLYLIKELADGKGNWLSLVLAFAILPGFYLKFAYDIQKEYADLAKTIFSSSAISRPDRLKMNEIAEQAIQVFQLEWGLVCAIAILVLANFSTVFVVDLSSFAKGLCGANGTSVPAGRSELEFDCGQVRSLLSIYSILTVLIIFFQISWARMIAIRRIRGIYLDLSALQPKFENIKKPSQ